MNAGEFQDLLHVDRSTSLDPRRARVLFVIALGLDDNVEDGFGIVVAIGHRILYQCPTFAVLEKKWTYDGSKVALSSFKKGEM